MTVNDQVTTLHVTASGCIVAGWQLGGIAPFVCRV
jgi:hypothetical protein